MTQTEFTLAMQHLLQISRDDLQLCGVPMSGEDWQAWRSNPSLYFLKQTSDIEAKLIFSLIQRRMMAERLSDNLDRRMRLSGGVA